MLSCMIYSNEEKKQIFEGRKVFDTSHKSKQTIGCATKYGESNFWELKNLVHKIGHLLTMSSQRIGLSAFEVVITASRFSCLFTDTINNSSEHLTLSSDSSQNRTMKSIWISIESLRGYKNKVTASSLS